MQLEGFVDISQALKCGVYALVAKGEVVYVGKSKCMLVRIYSHRNANRKAGTLPSWFPIKGVTFDEVHIQPCHPDNLDNLENQLINRYKPRHNILLKSTLPIGKPFAISVGGIALSINAGAHPTLPTIERRI